MVSIIEDLSVIYKIKAKYKFASVHKKKKILSQKYNLTYLIHTSMSNTQLDGSFSPVSNVLQEKCNTLGGPTVPLPKTKSPIRFRAILN